MDLMQFISDQLLILIVCLYALGVGIKRTKIIKSNYIPIILLFVGIGVSISIQGFSGDSFLQGVLCWGVAIGINQTGKQIKKGEK